MKVYAVECVELDVHRNVSFHSTWDLAQDARQREMERVVTDEVCERLKYGVANLGTIEDLRQTLENWYRVVEYEVDPKVDEEVRLE